MDINANKMVVQAYVEAINRFDMQALRRIFSPEARIYGVLGYGGLDVVEPIWRELHEGMNMCLEVLDMAAEGQNVVARYRETGRYTGFFRGLSGHEPTGKSYEITAMEWFVIEDGMITSRWGARDSAAITRQVTAS
ncbi:putative ester cyclase [Neorhizobium galegae]|uniref:ester cyclase n=1 Tax=Neorhizobium galegae TaxID=399 RepID=UPI00277E9C72|nr:nuclear transport factor 2 family protein [Neorhizobium galegae]MDQ0132234.1 putative ester cyclase [Neorhizobium galegae]